MKFPRVLGGSEDFFAGLQLPDHRFKSDLRLLKENTAGSSERDDPAVFFLPALEGRFPRVHRIFLFTVLTDSVIMSILTINNGGVI